MRISVRRPVTSLLCASAALLMSLTGSDARTVEKQSAESRSGIDMACVALKHMPSTSVFRQPFEIQVGRAGSDWHVTLRNVAAQEGRTGRQVSIRRKPNPRIKVTLIESSELDGTREAERDMSLRARAVAAFMEKAQLTQRDLEGATLSVNTIGLDYSIVFDPEPRFFGSSSVALVSRDLSRVTFFDRY